MSAKPTLLPQTRGSGIYIEGGTGNCIAGCTLRNLGIVGVQIGQGASPLPDGRHDAHHLAAEFTLVLPAPETAGKAAPYL